MTPATTRSATPDDIPVLVDLLGLLFSQEADFSPDPSLQTSALAHILGEPRFGDILVVEKAGTVVGMVSVLPTISTALGGPVGILEDMVIAPEGRGQGLGEMLLKAAIVLARQRHYGRLTLLTDHDNTAAMRFYERQGFARSAMVPFRLMLNL